MEKLNVLELPDRKSTRLNSSHQIISYAVALHSYAGFAAATEYGEKSVIATDLIDLIGPAMELAAKDALDDLGIMDEGSDDYPELSDL